MYKLCKFQQPLSILKTVQWHFHQKNADHTLNCKMEMLSCAQLKGANLIPNSGCGTQYLSTQLNWLIVNSHKVPIMNTFNISYKLRPYNSHTIFFRISILSISIGVTASPLFRFLTSTPLCRYMFPFPVLFSGSLHLRLFSNFFSVFLSFLFPVMTKSLLL